MCYAPLVVTGRGSGYSSDIFQSQLFYDLMSNDVIYLKHHKKYSLRMTGDDKVGMYVTWKLGLKIKFIPDCYVICRENLPAYDKNKGVISNFKIFRIQQLVRRYSGNSEVNRKRMIDLGIGKLGKRTLQSLIDQGRSIWTPLYGPTMAIFTSILFGHFWLMPTHTLRDLFVGIAF